MPGYNYDPTALSDKDLQDQINSFQTYGDRFATSQNNSPTELGLVQANTSNLNRAKSELASRQAKKNQSDQQALLMSLFGQGGGTGGQAGGGFDQTAYNQDLQNSAANQRQAIENTYNAQQQAGLQGLDERYNPLRKQAIEEAGVLGNLRSPAFQGTTLSNIDAQRSRDTSNLLGQIGAARGQAQGNLEQGLASQLGQGRQFGANLGQQQNALGLQRASALGGLLQGNQQFGQSFGLSQQKFNQDVGQQGFENLINMQGLNQASQLGNLQANANKKTGWDQFAGVAGGLGSLLGGTGGLMRGFKGAGNNGY